MSRTPKVRFKGFEEPWKLSRLGDIASSFAYGLNAAAKEYDGKHKYLRITDIDDVSHVFRADDLTSPDTDILSASSYQLQDGDILFARTGASVGKTYIYRPSDGVVYYAGFLIRAKVRPEHSDEFIFQSTLGTEYRDYIKITSQRSGQPGVNAQEYSDYTLFVPNLKEQQTIGRFLRNLDTLIEQNQSEVDRLRNLKKAMLQKMFPQKGSKVPEIRFKDFSDVWKSKKFSQIASMHARIGWQNLRKSEFLTSGDYYLITGTDFVDGRVDFTNCHFVKKERYDQDPHIQVSNGSILITKDGTLGKVAYVSGLNKPATLNAGVFNVNPIDYEAVDTLYLYQYLKAPFLLDYVAERATGGTIKHLNQNILVDFPVLLPSVEEQRLIGQYFQDLDSLIEQRRSNTDRLRHLKQSMLQRMFI